jgi:chemotaxis response regulator CheB
MPGAVTAAGLADRVLPLAAIGAEMLRFAARGTSAGKVVP